MRKIISGIILCALASQAWASNWQLKGTVTNDEDLYYDADSIRRTGDIAQIWIKWDAAKNKNVTYRTRKELWKYNCSDHSTFTDRYIDYDAHGNVLGSSGPSGPPAESQYYYLPVTTDTVQDIMMHVV